MNITVKKVFIIAVLVLILPGRARAGDCSLANEFAAKAIAMFDHSPKEALAGLMQAHQWCPNNGPIAYNLGLAYHRYRRPDKAYETWAVLAARNPSDRQVVSNLAWVAFKLKHYDKALTWANKAGKSQSTALLRISIMYRRGQYEQAMEYAGRHALILPKGEEKKAAGYLVEKNWKSFRAGNRDAATKSMITLAKKYPKATLIQQAKDKMVMAMWDDSVDIPVPSPLPDETLASAGSTPVSGGMGFVSEELPLVRARQSITPTDKAYAVIVGIRDYQTINGPRFADNDARQMQRMLTRFCGFKNDAAHVKLLLNKDATLGNLLNSLSWLERKAKLNPGAKILFYFSGHGSPILGDDRTSIRDGLLIPHEANLDNLSDRTAISLAELDKRFASISNPNVVTVIDACFSGSGKSASGMKLIKPKVNKALLSSRKLFITASAADRPAEEYSPGRQGAFSYFFLKALMGDGDTNKDGWVDTVEAFTYAKAKLNALDLEQNPQISVNKALKLSKVP